MRKLGIPVLQMGGWIRSRLRSMQLKKWKKPEKFQRMMIRAGFNPHESHRVWIKMDKWQSVPDTRREYGDFDSWTKRGLAGPGDAPGACSSILSTPLIS